MIHKPSNEVRPPRIQDTAAKPSGHKEGTKKYQNVLSEELKRFIERSQDAIYRYDIGARCFVFYNTIGKALFGITEEAPATATAKTVFMRIHPEDRKKVRASAQASLVSGIDGGEVEYRILRTDGSIGWMHDRWIVIRNPAGESVAIEGIVRDDTRRKEIEIALRESEEKYRMVAHATSDLILRFQIEDETFSYISPNCEDVIGYTADEMRHKKFYRDAILEEDFRKIKHQIIAAFKGTRDKMALKYRIRCKDGRIKYFAENSTLVRDERGRVVHVIASLKDLTETVKMEEQLRKVQKMEAIGTLASGIAHDFNNILSAIMGNAEIALYSLDQPTQVFYCIEQILEASKRAGDLVKHILTFSRQTEQELKPMKLSIIVTEALKLIRATIPTTIEIRQKISVGRDTVLGDPSQIHQLLMNLFTNATHAMVDQGGILQVALSTLYLDAENPVCYPNLMPGAYVRLTVSDTGHGMSADVVEQIFDPYFTTKGKGVGTGLGLAVVHGIVKRANGSIMVDSKPEKGTTFDVFFPLSEAATTSENDRIETIPFGTERILFVDDEVFLVDLGKRMLQHLGYDVVARTGSVEALNAFKARPDQFDVVITDMTMPHLTGEKLSQEILRIRPDIPIILCTGFGEMVATNKIKEIGIKGFVKKPIVLHEIAETIRNVLKA